MLIKVRYNTEHAEGQYRWRVIRVVGGEWHESLATDVWIKVPCYTTCDKLPNGKTKHHITMEHNKIRWIGDMAIIE